MTDSTATELVGHLAGLGPSRVVDVGCGWAELLLRLLDACPAAEAVGIDRDTVLLERARHNALERGLSERVRFEQTYDAAALDGAELVLCVGSEHVIGSYEDALAAFAQRPRPPAHLLVGTAFWERPPTDEQIMDFGELPDLPELLEQTQALGWRARMMVVATERDWDRFEFGFMSDLGEEVDDYRRGYLARRGVLGFVYLLLDRA